MGDPLNNSGNQVHAPVTHSDVLKTQDVSNKGRKFNRTVSIVEAAPQKGLRARAKNFLPRPLYKFLVSLVSSNNKAQYELGKMISQTRKDSADAWQKLGQYHALPPSSQKPNVMYKLQLDCRIKDLELDLLQGWGDSPVTIEKQKVIKLLEQCVESPDDEALVGEYENACTELKKVEYDQDTLRLRRTKLKNEAKSLSPKLAAAKEINIRIGLVESSQLDPPELTEEEQIQEAAILEQGKTAFDRLKVIKKKLAAIETDIKRYDNSLVDDERARDAVFYYEETAKVRGKGER